MSKFLDALADAHFVPQNDGRVRVFISRFYRLGFDLSSAQAEGAKLVWRSLIRCYIHATHVSAVLAIFVPWAGLLLLFLSWFVKTYMVQATRRQSGNEFRLERGEFDGFYGQLAQSVSRRAAISLGILASALTVLPISLSQRDLVLFGRPIEPVSVLALVIVGLGWVILFTSLVHSPQAKDRWDKP